MPSLDEFNQYSQKYVKDVVLASAGALQKGSDAGAEYMRQYISQDSPTGTPWHKRINNERGNRPGARKQTGAMLNAVGSTKISVNSSQLSSTFGWVKDRQDYFLQQDTGGYWLSAYGKPSGVGMGLLNLAQDGGGNSTLRVLGAYNSGISKFISEMKNAGFKTSSNIGEVF